MEKEKKKSGKIKKIVIGAIVIFVLFIIFCCLAGGDDSEGTVEGSDMAGEVEEVKELVGGYCEAMKRFDLDSTGKYLASEPDYWVDMNENVLDTFMDVFKDGVSSLEYTIEDIKVDEEQEIFSWADAAVRFRFLDYSKVMSASLDRLENEYETGALSSDASDEEIYRRLYEIFAEEQKTADEIWNEIEMDFSLAKNRNKSNPAWYIDSLPEEISVILMCNTESSFEKYAGVSNESNTVAAEQRENSSRYHIGDTVAFETDNGGEINVTLTEWGSLQDYMGNPVIYVKYTIENVGEETVTVGDSLFDVYADDYSAKTSVTLPMEVEEVQIFSRDLSPGRKVDGVRYADINPDNVSVIEVECGGSVFVIKDDSDKMGTQDYEGDYSFDLWTLAGEYEGEDVTPSSNMSINIYSSPEDDKVGNYIITIPSSGIEYTGELYRDSDKIFALVSNEEVYAVIEVIDDTSGAVIIHYVEDDLECNYRMYESYPMP